FGVGGLGRIGRITPSGVVDNSVAYAPSPAAIAAGPDGALWFIQFDESNWLGRVTTTGTLDNDPTPAVYDVHVGPTNRSPNDIAFDREGNAWFVIDSYETIGRMTP